jgi:flagellar biosynthesis/type III secretory pathway M-ring protein FliF/YscJ
MMPGIASALPENTGDGYVAAAYIVFFVLLLIYLAIMALRLSRVQRDLRDLQARTQESAQETRQSAGEKTGRDPAGRSDTRDERTREREPA